MVYPSTPSTVPASNQKDEKGNSGPPIDQKNAPALPTASRPLKPPGPPTSQAAGPNGAVRRKSDAGGVWPPPKPALPPNMVGSAGGGGGVPGLPSPVSNHSSKTVTKPTISGPTSPFAQGANSGAIPARPAAAPGGEKPSQVKSLEVPTGGSVQKPASPFAPRPAQPSTQSTQTPQSPQSPSSCRPPVAQGKPADIGGQSGKTSASVPVVLRPEPFHPPPAPDSEADAIMQELRSSIPRSNSSTSTPIASSVSNVALALRSSTSKGPVGAAPSCAKPIAPENLTAPISPFAVRSTSTTTRSPFSPKEDVVDAPSISLWSGGTRKSIPGTSERIRKASNEEGTVGTVAERKGSQDGVVAPRPAPSGIVRADAVARPSTPGPPEMPSAAPLRALQSGIAKVGTVAASQPLADKPSIVLARRASSAAAVDSGIAKSVSVGGSQTLADAPPIVLTRRASSVAVPGLPMSGWEPDEDDFDSPHVSGELQPRFKGLGKRETKTEDRRSPRSSKTGSADGLLKSDAPSNPIHRVFSAGTIAKSALLQPAVSTPAVGTPPPGSLQAAAQLTPGARSTTALSGPAPAKPSQQGSVPNIGEGGPSLGSMGSVGSNIGSLPEVTLSATSIRVQPKDEVMVEPFERSSSGLFNLEPGWENEEFEDPKYNVWRKAMLETLPLQIDYPLLLPPELVALVMEDFEAS